MKWVRDTTNRFKQRPHYEPAELDRGCEALITAFLKQRHGRVMWPVSTDDLIALIERDADDLDLYADLTTYGESVEGATLFVQGKNPRVMIAHALSEDAARENRLRTTLTHEYGHVHYHDCLFNLAEEDLFSEGAADGSRGGTGEIQVCKRDSLLEANSVDWMEWQAGHVCGAILMPASYVRRLIHDGFADRLGADAITPEGPLAREMMAALQQTYQVSADAARVRLLRLGLLQTLQPTPSLFVA